MPVWVRVRHDCSLSSIFLELRQCSFHGTLLRFCSRIHLHNSLVKFINMNNSPQINQIYELNVTYILLLAETTYLLGNSVFTELSNFHRMQWIFKDGNDTNKAFNLAICCVWIVQNKKYSTKYEPNIWIIFSLWIDARFTTAKMHF